MSYTTNIFRSKKSISDLGIKVYRYRPVNIAPGDGKYKVLGNLCRELSAKFGILATRYSIEDKDYLLLFNLKDIQERIEVGKYILEFESEDELGNYVLPVKRLLYELTRQKLEYHGFWQVNYNRYYSLASDKTINGKYHEYDVYRGVFFRYDIFNGYIWLVLDSVSKIVLHKSIFDMIVEMGEDKVRGILEQGRYVIVKQIRGGYLTYRLQKVSRLRTDLRAGIDEIIKIESERYTIKSYYSDYKGFPEFAEKIDDNEPLIEVEGGGYYATSMVHLVLRSKDIEGETDELRKEIFLSPDRHYGHIMRFFDTINPLRPSKGLNIPTIEFLKDPVSCGFEYFDPPDIKFGNSGVCNLKDEGGFENYTKFFRSCLKKYGPARGLAGFSHNDRIVLVYPRECLTEEHVKGFYQDVKMIAKRFLRVKLPPVTRTYIWEYSGDDIIEVLENYDAFKDNIRAVLCILRNDEDPLYFEFKKVFGEKACQMGTKDLVLMKYDLPGSKRHVYRNSVLGFTCGLLGKMGTRPWLLNERLSGDFYIGIDSRPGKVAVFTLIDHYGDYIDEVWRPINGAKIDEDTIKDAIIHLLMKKRKLLSKDRPIHVVIHRDGDIYYDEMNGISNACNILGKRGINIHLTIVSIKESIPHRIFQKFDNDMILSCNPGVFLKLNEQSGVLASTGYPLIEQGVARPLLIEVVRNDCEDYPLNKIAKEIYYLSFLHWEGIIKKVKMPITIRYADKFAVFAEKDIDVVGPPL